MYPNEALEQPKFPLLVEMDAFAEQLVEQAWDLFSLFDMEGSMQYASAGFTRIVGFVPQTFHQIANLIDSEYRVDLHKLFAKAQTGRAGKVEFRARRHDDSKIWLECKAIPIRQTDGSLAQIACVLSDITDRKRQEKKLAAMAYRDPLTGLPNRRLFKEHLQQAMHQTQRTGRPFALLYMDLDDFKMINDTMGHDVGDAFLQAFAKRIKGCLREIDTFARMGGDEFTVLLPAVDRADNVDTVARRIFKSAEEAWEIEGHVFHSTVSMGIAIYPTDGTDAASLLKHVDIALYQAKGRGRNDYQFYRPN